VFKKPDFKHISGAQLTFKLLLPARSASGTMANPAFWTAIPESESDNDDDEDWSLPPPDPKKEAEIRAALDAANALRRSKMEAEISYESEEDRRKRERDERRKQLLLRMEQMESASENTAPASPSNAPPTDSPPVPQKKALPGADARCPVVARALTSCCSVVAEYA
jgi:hypothetical protein